MSRNEAQTCRELIEPALRDAGWGWDAQVEIGPGPVNLTGEAMYDPSQRIVADYLLKLWSMPLAVLEAKREGEPASNGMQQGSRYAQRLGLRFSIASNGREYIVTDNESGKYESFATPPSPGDILSRMGRNIVWRVWRPVFEAPWHEDQVTRKQVRPYQEMAIFETLYRFSQKEKRVLLLMATGTGKTFTVFQLVWKLLAGSVLPSNRVLFLTDRNSLKDQAYRAFSAFDAHERVMLDKDVVARGDHRVGKVFFANYQNLDEELDGKKLFEHFDSDFFGLVVVDECHRSGFGDWFGVLEHFGEAFQLGLTATPREIESSRRLTDAESRRDTFDYFGDPAYAYSLKQAIEDGYLVPYLLDERITNLDEQGYVGPDGKRYTTSNFERDIRLPDRTRVIAEDFWHLLGKYRLREEKTIVFCVDDTHAAFMAAELRRISGDPDYAARITRSERNSHQLERNFAEVGGAKPRVAVTVDLLSHWIDKGTRKDVRAELKDRDVHVAAFRHFYDLDATDDVDILAKVGFDLARVPARRDRVARFWDQEDRWLVNHVGEQAIGDDDRVKTRFWQTSLDHYGLYGIDDLEQGGTYSAPQFTTQFGSFSSLLSRYGGAAALRSDLEAVKQRLYVPMAA